MKKFLSFLFSLGLLSALVGLLWLIDIVRYSPDIPAQTPDGNFIELILQKKKHNHIDDFCPPCVERTIAVERTKV